MQEGVYEQQGGKGQYGLCIFAEKHPLMQRHQSENAERRQAPVVAAWKDLMDEDEPAAGQHDHGGQGERQDQFRKLFLVQRRDQHDQQHVANAQRDQDAHHTAHPIPEHADVGADAGENEDRAEIGE
ncbi:MAG: hypothetical protein AW09_001139 [Candidatus Accumulibacter phosphatis]|uniref:Uncharacterized protein n=1 Tax=Candidatus Accumulibacter phosphatis TaxID=327160 RepID=A0A080M936_9PROT|nr:MAG: hypothetical protein AW09_001139 [Candidatus Accumulibacter phosphatis]